MQFWVSRIPVEIENEFGLEIENLGLFFFSTLNMRYLGFSEISESKLGVCCVKELKCILSGGLESKENQI